MCSLSTSNLAHPWARDRRVTHDVTRMETYVITGLLQVRPGDVWKQSGLMEWGREAEFLHQYMRSRVDAHTYVIEQVYKLAEPESVYMQCTPQSDERLRRLQGPNAAMLFMPHGNDEVANLKVLSLSGHEQTVASLLAPCTKNPPSCHA